ncbi:hypothetical protein T484DRAFT_1883694, partial [Baffinella frigidus]
MRGGGGKDAVLLRGKAAKVATPGKEGGKEAAKEGGGDQGMENAEKPEDEEHIYKEGECLIAGVLRELEQVGPDGEDGEKIMMGMRVRCLFDTQKEKEQKEQKEPGAKEKEKENEGIVTGWIDSDKMYRVRTAESEGTGTGASTEAEDLVVPRSELKVLSVIARTSEELAAVPEIVLQAKADLLDLAGATPRGAINWPLVRGAVWGAEVMAATIALELNTLLHELTASLDLGRIEDWWKPWEGFEKEPEILSAGSRRCQFTDGNKCKCKCAALPGKTVCKRHIRKQLACAGVQGFQLIKPGTDKLDIMPPGAEKWCIKGKSVEVLWEGEWWQAKIAKVSSGNAVVSYIGAHGLVSDETESIKIASTRIRPPTAGWSAEAKGGSAGPTAPGTPAGDADGDGEDGDGDKQGDDEGAEAGDDGEG